MTDKEHEKNLTNTIAMLTGAREGLNRRRMDKERKARAVATLEAQLETLNHCVALVRADSRMRSLRGGYSAAGTEERE